MGFFPNTKAAAFIGTVGRMLEDARATKLQNRQYEDQRGDVATNQALQQQQLNDTNTRYDAGLNAEKQRTMAEHVASVQALLGQNRINVAGAKASIANVGKALGVDPSGYLTAFDQYQPSTAPAGGQTAPADTPQGIEAAVNPGPWIDPPTGGTNAAAPPPSINDLLGANGLQAAIAAGTRQPSIMGMLTANKAQPPAPPVQPAQPTPTLQSFAQPQKPTGPAGSLFARAADNPFAGGASLLDIANTESAVNLQNAQAGHAVADTGLVTEQTQQLAKKWRDPAIFRAEIATLPEADQRAGVGQYNQAHGTSFPMPGERTASGAITPYYTPDVVTSSEVGQRNAAADAQTAAADQTRAQTAQMPDELDLKKRFTEAQIRNYEATTGHTIAETGTVGPESTARIGLMGAQANSANAAASSGSGERQTLIAARMGYDRADQDVAKYDQSKQKNITLWQKYEAAAKAKSALDPVDGKTSRTVPELHALAETYRTAAETDNNNILDAQQKREHFYSVLNSRLGGQDAALEAIQAMIGKDFGRFGCARAVGAIASAAGMPLPVTERAKDMEAAMSKAGWKQVPMEQAQIVFMPGSGPSGRHVAWRLPDGRTVEDHGGTKGTNLQYGLAPKGDNVTGWAYVPPAPPAGGKAAPTRKITTTKPLSQMTVAELQALRAGH
jgi:hypothetical protein